MRYRTHVYVVSVWFVLTLCLGMHLFAGTTGKISGRILDAGTDEPLPGANVFIEGTSLGAATDMDGYYIILNIPPGLYTLQIRMMGYQKVTKSNIQVSVDRITTEDFNLNQEAIAGQEITVIGKRDLIEIDRTHSMNAVSAEEMETLPVQSVNAVIRHQAGVRVDGNDIRMRGGRQGEVTIMVDGIDVSNPYNGRSTITVDNSAIQEVQTIAGTFNAEYGKAMGGIVNIITKEGAAGLKGKATFYVGDLVSKFDQYEVLNDVDLIDEDGDGDIDRAVGRGENPVWNYFNPEYDIDLSLSGAVPYTKNRLTFFTAGRYNYRTGREYGRKWFTPQGFTGDSSLVALNVSENLRALGKLTYKLSNSMKLKYALMWNKNPGRRVNGDNANYKYNPDGRRFQYSDTYDHMITLNHVLSSKTFYELKFASHYNQSKSCLYENPNAMPNYLLRASETDSLGITTVATFDPDDVTQEYLAEWRAKDANSALDVDLNWVVDPDDPEGYIAPDSTGGFPSNSYRDIGTDLGRSNNTDKYFTAKFDLTSQFHRAHELKLGLEARLYEIHRDNVSQLEAKTELDENGQEVKIIPFTPVVPGLENINRTYYTVEPREFSAYMQDRIELKEMTMNIGLRFDYFDPNVSVFTDPEDINIYDPLTFKYRYTNAPAHLADNISSSITDKDYTQTTLDQRKSLMLKKVDPKYQISPRIGIAYPISDQGVVHFSYGHFFQMPLFNQLYRDPNFRILRGNVGREIGNPNLDAQKTVQYEVGLQQALTDVLRLDVTVFYKDIRDWPQVGFLTYLEDEATSYVQYVNKDYGNVRGFTIVLDKRFASGFHGRLDYTYQVDEATYSDENDARNAALGNAEPALKMTARNQDVTHDLSARLGLQLKGWNLSLIGSFRTGQPYTPSAARGAGSMGFGSVQGWFQNSQRRPNISSIDLYVDRKIKYKSLSYMLFARIYNLFDQKGSTQVFADSGTAEYTSMREEDAITYHSSRIGTTEHFWLNPGMFQGPRRIQLGVGIEF